MHPEKHKKNKISVGINLLDEPWGGTSVRQKWRSRKPATN
jgi:hypothetical protein